jgi:hypothetical protein
MWAIFPLHIFTKRQYLEALPESSLVWVILQMATAFLLVMKMDGLRGVSLESRELPVLEQIELFLKIKTKGGWRGSRRRLG